MALLYKKKKVNKQEEIAARDAVKLLALLKNFYDESVQIDKERRKKWKKQYKYWVNAQTPAKRPEYKSDIRVNYCWVTTQVKIPHMTQNKPKITFIPYDKGEEAEKRAEVKSLLVGNSLWHKLGMQEKQTDVLWDSMVYDIGYWKIGWDPDAEDGKGEIFANTLEPFKFLRDPASRNIQDGRYCIHIEPYPVDLLKGKYPQYTDKIKEDRVISDILFEERRGGEREPSSGLITEQTKFSVKRALLKEFWLSPKVCDLKIKDKDGEVKYKNGRVITMIGEMLIVDDRPNPYTHGRFPFVAEIMNKVGNEFYGMGDIEQIVPLQDALNHAYQQIDDIVGATCNLGWTVDPNLGDANIKKLAAKIARPGALKLVPLDKIRVDIPPQIPPFLAQRPNDLIQRIFDISGISEIMQGSGRVTHRTARGIEKLFEAGSTRIGQSIQYHEAALREVALQMDSLTGQFYKEERIVAIIGGNGAVSGNLEVKVEDLKGKYEVTIDSGAALPKDKQSKADLAMNLLQAGVFEMALNPDPAVKKQAEVVLNAVEFPGREELLNFKAPPPPPPPPPEPQLQGGMMPPPGMGAPAMPVPPGLPPGLPPEMPPAPMAGGLPPEIMEMIAASGMPPEQFLAALQAGMAGNV